MVKSSMGLMGLCMKVRLKIRWLMEKGVLNILMGILWREVLRIIISMGL